MPYAQSTDGVSIWYELHGNQNGIPVIFSHGFAFDSSMWSKQLGLFPPSCPFRVILYDMRAHGKSTVGTEHLNISKQTQVEDLLAVYTACGVKKAILLGHSMGGHDNLLFVLKYPERVNGCILYGTGPGFGSDKSRLAWNETATIMAQKYLDHTDTRRIGLGHFCLRAFRQHEGDALYKTLPNGPLTLAKVLPSITIPVEIVVGSADRGFLGASRMMHKKLPVSRYTEIEGGKHLMNISAADAFNSALENALDSLRRHVQTPVQSKM
eukprot:m.162564 g.162564  ORF g.162564 m.162564 type:complete len:267 (-) comp18073_c0_seq1:375-1175(-)